MICLCSCCLFFFRGREFRPAADSLSFASPKESKQRKGDPTVCDPCASLRGNLRCSRFAGSRRTRCAQTAASPDPRNAPLLGAARGASIPDGPSLCSAWDRAFASLGGGLAPSPCSLSPWGEGGGEGIGLHAGDALFLCRGPSPQPSPQGEREQFRPSAAKAREVFRRRAKRWPAGIQTPSVCAEERSVSRTRARSCLSEASSARPRETRAPQVAP